MAHEEAPEKWDPEKYYTSNRYCYTCKQTVHFGHIVKVNKHDPSQWGKSYCCLVCKPEIYKENDCKSSKYPCVEKFKCRCGSLCSPCKTSWAWTANLHHKDLEIIATGAREGIVQSSFKGENKLIRICGVCARWPGVVCKPFYNEDYLMDHSRARCVNCHMFNFTQKKSYGYCTSCSVKP